MKDFFIINVGKQVFNQALITNMSENVSNFDDMYKLMLARYPSKHDCDMSIRQLIKAHRKRHD